MVSGRLVILAGGVSSRMKNSVSIEDGIDPKLIEDAEKKSKGMIRIGGADRPFLDYLLFNSSEAGYDDIVIVINKKDNSIKDYYSNFLFQKIKISYAIQNIHPGFEKPLGTADALNQALSTNLKWQGGSFTMCNSDNLYSVHALELMRMSNYANAMIDYDRNGLEVEEERIEKFAVTRKDNEGFLVDIIEKPSVVEVEDVKGKDGFIGVSMNLFRFNYDMIFPFLENVPLHPVRREKELPAAVKMMIDKNPKSLFCIPLKEHVPDLTSKSDILTVKKYLEKHYPKFHFEIMNKKKIVVTGGAGFIGSHIVEYWLNENAEVHIIDNLRSGYLSNVKLFPDAVFHRGSITDRDLVFKVMMGADYVHHLAALVSVPESVEKPEECYKINIKGLINVLDASKEYGIKKIVLSSSAAIYGENPISPKTVDLIPDPKSPYGETKLEGESLLNNYNLNFGLGATSLRYFNVFGPRQDPKSQYAAAVPIFVEKALKNEPLIIYGDGSQTRDFIFVKDVVKANVLAATNTIVNGIFNVATGHAISINEIAKLVLSETGSKSEIVYESERPGDIKHSLASIETTKSKLNFEPEYDLMKGLKETINYFAQQLK